MTTRCPNGTRRNKKNGICEKKIDSHLTRTLKRKTKKYFTNNKMEQVIDLSSYELTNENITNNIKEKFIHNIIGHIFTDKIDELYGLDKNKKIWVIKYDKLCFELQLVSHNEQTMIRIRSTNMSNASKIYKLLKFKEVNNQVLHK